MPAASIQHWAKTAEGIEIIESQVMFCIGGELWQGHKMVPIRVSEIQISDDELKAAHDIDGTKSKIWFSRRQRLEGRHARKSKEYDKRRHELRQERSQIITSIKEAKELGIEASPDDLDQIKRINERMAGLVDMAAIERIATAEVMSMPVAPEAEAEPERIDRGAPVRCAECGKEPPGDYEKDPRLWLKGHMMGSHKQKAS